MLCTNFDVAKHLVNGNMDIITEIIWPHFRCNEVYVSVHVDFSPDGIHVIKPMLIQFPAKYSYETTERQMLPIIQSWASTIDKMQDCVVDYAVIYLGSRLFAAARACVVHRHGRSVDGIQIEELDCSKLTGKVPCNGDALNEIARLWEHEWITLGGLSHIIQ